MDLTANELEWLTGHLGHSRDVHKLFYRTHISTTELAEVSKSLFAVDQGKAYEFAGKHMQDTDIDGIPSITDAESPVDSEGSFDEKLSVDTNCVRSQTAKNEELTVEDKGISSDDEMQQMEVNEDSSFISHRC